MESISTAKTNTILIIDDSSTSRMITQRCFEMTGFSGCNYYFAENGLEALDVLKNDEIDLIVTDINMPKMDGKNFILKIKKNENTCSIPILVISTMAGSYLEDELYNIGVQWVLKKPVVPAKILKLLGE